MQVIRKIWQRLGDPLFYRRRARDLARRWKSFDDEPKTNSLDTLGEIDTALVFVAHPDDEIFCSGIICELVERGVEVTVLCLTKGEGGPTGDSTREELGAVRTEEMYASCDVLGVKRVEFLGHIDPVAEGYRVFAPAVSAEDLARQIQPEFEKADLVISHGSSGEYWHPAHLLVFAAAERALEECQNSGWLTFLARQPDHPIPRLVNLDDPVFLSLDVRRHREKRWDALSSHTSQLGLFAKFAGGCPEDCVDLVTTENYCLRRPTNRESD